jgi:Protein of unknown function (DUF2905)
MGTLLLTALIILLTLGGLAYWAERRPGAIVDDKPPVYSLLPGDIKYESPSGNFRFYFPVTTSIVLSVVVTILLRLFS